MRTVGARSAALTERRHRRAAVPPHRPATGPATSAAPTRLPARPPLHRPVALGGAATKAAGEWADEGAIPGVGTVPDAPDDTGLLTERAFAARAVQQLQ